MIVYAFINSCTSDGWSKVWDAFQQRHYWWHKESGETEWVLETEDHNQAYQTARTLDETAGNEYSNGPNNLSSSSYRWSEKIMHHQSREHIGNAETHMKQIRPSTAPADFRYDDPMQHKEHDSSIWNRDHNYDTQDHLNSDGEATQWWTHSETTAEVHETGMDSGEKAETFTMKNSVDFEHGEDWDRHWDEHHCAWYCNQSTCCCSLLLPSIYLAFLLTYLLTHFLSFF